MTFEQRTMDYRVVVVKPDIKVGLKQLKADTELAQEKPFVFCVFGATRRHSPKLRRRKTEPTIRAAKSPFYAFPFVCAEKNLWDLHVLISQHIERNYPMSDYRQLEVGIGSFNEDLECRVIRFHYQCNGTAGQIFQAIVAAQSALVDE